MKEEANIPRERRPGEDAAPANDTQKPTSALPRPDAPMTAPPRVTREKPHLEKTRPAHWLWLLAAIVLEVAATTVMAMSHHWTFAHAGALGIGLMWLGIALSYVSLAKATTGIPVGVAFAFWEGLGLVLVSLAGVFVLSETLTLPRAAGLALVLVGALLVHKGTSHGDEDEDEGEGHSHRAASAREPGTNGRAS